MQLSMSTRGRWVKAVHAGVEAVRDGVEAVYAGVEAVYAGVEAVYDGVEAVHANVARHTGWISLGFSRSNRRERCPSTGH